MCGPGARTTAGREAGATTGGRCDMKAEVDPNLIVYFGGQYVPLCEARVGILTHALHYGTGVFEGIRAYWDDAEQELFVMRPREHYERWKQNCGILRIDVPLTAEQLCAITVGADAAQRIPHQSLRSAAGLQVRRAHRCVHRRSGCILHCRAALRRISAQRKRTARRRQLMAADRRQCHSGARQNLRRLCQQRAGQRRSAALRIRRSHSAERNRPCGRRRHLQPLHGAQGAADHAAGDGERAGRHHARFHHGTGAARTWASRLWSGPSTAANCTCATSCSSPERRWAWRRWCASIIAPWGMEPSAWSRAACASCTSTRRTDAWPRTANGCFRFIAGRSRRSGTRRR